MTKQELLRKVSSRKFWAMLMGLVTSLLILFKVNADTTTQIVGAVGAFGSIVMYMLAEAYVDGQRAEVEIITPEELGKFQ